MHGLGRVAGIGSYSLLRCTGSVVLGRGLSCSVACGIFLYQGWNTSPLHPRWILIHCTTREVHEYAFGHEMLNDLDTLESKNPEEKIYICVCTCVCVHTQFGSRKSPECSYLIPRNAISCSTVDFTFFCCKLNQYL